MDASPRPRDRDELAPRNLAIRALDRAPGDNPVPGDEFGTDQTAAHCASLIPGDRTAEWANTLTLAEIRALIPTLHGIADEHDRRAQTARRLASTVANIAHDALEQEVHSAPMTLAG